jgi:hypothetical protein
VPLHAILQILLPYGGLSLVWLQGRCATKSKKVRMGFDRWLVQGRDGSFMVDLVFLGIMMLKDDRGLDA